MTLAAALAGKPKAQVLLCNTEQQRDLAAALFPAAVAVWANGSDDWHALQGRSVVAFSTALADAALPHAASLKLIAVEIPTPPPPHPLRWAKANAVPYNAAGQALREPYSPAISAGHPDKPAPAAL